MSFAGHVFDAISRIKHNEALKKNSINRYKNLKNLYLKYT